MKIVRKNMYARTSEVWSHFQRERVPGSSVSCLVVSAFLCSVVAAPYTYCAQWTYYA